MEHNQSAKIIKLVVICILASLLNIFISVFFRSFMGFPLFLDTVFTAAVTFAFGLIPGIAVAALSLLIPYVYYKSFNFFILCSIAEVLLIYALKPAPVDIPDYAPKEKTIAYYTSIAAKLMLLYITCAISISVLGGVIDYVSQVFLGKHYFSVEDTFKLSLIMNNLPILAVNILSRIPINIVDRFIVIFGGYFISLGLKKITQEKIKTKNNNP
ncbi:MAG: hypothetical protein LBU66_01095 [Treponema sp.]|jgi:hypothetical protein|nr:hypothetical protein [Treponema sp.]